MSNDKTNHGRVSLPRREHAAHGNGSCARGTLAFGARPGLLREMFYLSEARKGQTTGERISGVSVVAPRDWTDQRYRGKGVLMHPFAFAGFEPLARATLCCTSRRKILYSVV